MLRAQTISSMGCLWDTAPPCPRAALQELPIHEQRGGKEQKCCVGVLGGTELRWGAAAGGPQVLQGGSCHAQPSPVSANPLISQIISAKNANYNRIVARIGINTKRVDAIVVNNDFVLLSSEREGLLILQQGGAGFGLLGLV